MRFGFRNSMPRVTYDVLSDDNMSHARQCARLLRQGLRNCTSATAFENLNSPWKHYATKPDSTVYGGPKTPSASRVTLRVLQQKYRTGQKISMVTAYDYPSAVHVSFDSQCMTMKVTV